MLNALARLNHISAEINRATSDQHIRVEETLRLVAEGAAALFAGVDGDAQNENGRVSTVIYAYDAETAAFDPDQRVAAGVKKAVRDEPRPDGLGARALRLRRRVLSYEEDVALHPHMAAAGALAGVCYPLLVAEQMVGALYVYLHEDRRFSELELLLLDNFVNQAAMAIHRAQQLSRIQRHLKRKEEELIRLRRADLLISSRPDLEETLEAILQMALEVTGARYGILRQVDSSGEQLITRAIAGDDLGRPAVEALPINATSITGWVAKYRQPLCIADVRRGAWSRIYYPLDHEMEMRSELAVPLIGAGGRLEGVINLESPQVAAFSEEDSLLLQSLATQAVIAIQDMRLLDALLEVSERLLTEPAARVNQRLVELACELLNAPVSALWTLEGDELVLKSANAGFDGCHRVPLWDSLIGEAVLRRELVYSDDVRNDERFACKALAQRAGRTQALVAPLLSGDERDPVGALSVFNIEDARGRFTGSDWDKKVLAFLAHFAALAVSNAAHQEALRLEREQRHAAETFAAVGDIAANLLHRLNNKIGIIPVRVEGIQDKCQPALQADAYLAHNLAQIEQSAIEAMAEVRESLFYLRPLQLSPVDAAVAVAEAIREAELPASVKVRTSGLENLPPVMAGHRRLALVFINLLENASTAMKGRGDIHIRGARRREWIEIEVSDEGPGIPPELHERIFEFNYSGAKRASGKLGFGLWWVKTLMARFGGSIRVESDGQNGATFILRLPMARSEARSQKPGAGTGNDEP